MVEDAGGSQQDQRFGRYSLLEPLAKGGMAQIYKAATPQGKVFTLKKILQDYSSNPDFIKMFLDEAKISLNLKHPHIVRVLDFGQVDGTYFLAMEYVFGRDVGGLLRASVEKKVHIPIDVACLIILQCARGLDYAHTLVDSFGKPTGIIHRDISPPNILLSYNGDAKVLDFGIAKAVRQTTRQNTRSGVLKGKFSYMSPEQASGKPLSAQSDLFSLAIVFYELLTSRSLFYCQDEIETLEKVRKADIPSIRKIRKDLPAELEKIVLKALKKKEKDRYTSCAEFADAIRAFMKANFPRSDARSMARFVRSLFQEDFHRRHSVAQKEGWVDVLASGAADDELLIDRSFTEASGQRVLGTRPHRISFWQRLLYDPRTNLKVSRWVSRIGFPLLALAAGLYLWDRGHLDRWWSEANEIWFENAETLAPPARSAPEEPKTGFQYWVSEAAKAQAEGNYEKAQQALDRAREINSIDPRVATLTAYQKLALGQGCESVTNQRTLPAADQILIAALCSEWQGDWQRSIAHYRDFIDRHPTHERRGDAEKSLQSLILSLKRKER
jgi:serine/threonine protein kinase